MIRITDRISIHENEIREEFIRSSGPGGQNVNKVASAVRLRFDICGSSLPEDVREGLLKLPDGRITDKGELIIEAGRYRRQEFNRKDALDRLTELIRQATVKPKIRRKTKQTAASKKRILEAKRRRGAVKRLRRAVPREGKGGGGRAAVSLSLSLSLGPACLLFA